ncbi:hypothetical protein JXA63_03060 [Candidatus Woesebacteria bacterium]|nr:hypothetical protein [Candidatus Woesebacteria bacterium]
MNDQQNKTATKSLKISSRFFYVVNTVTKVFLTAALVPAILVFMLSVYRYAFTSGYNYGLEIGVRETENYYLGEIQEINNKAVTTYEIVEGKPPAPVPTRNPSLIINVSWGGPELWEEVNQKRVEYGVGTLDQRDELCTIASLRLNELLELGRLDGHEGFGNLQENRPDLEWIFEKYGTIAEFLVAGAETATEAVDLWDNTLGHKKLLTGGEYVWGCTYAQNGFGVAIAAF